MITRFDHVFKECTYQVFDALKRDLNAALQGRNLTVFAYGQSGSGKTWTINGSKSEVGLIPATLEFLLSEPAVCQVSMSWMQVYNEKILDLLSDSNAGLELLQVNKNLIISGLIEKRILEMQQFWDHHQ